MQSATQERERATWDRREPSDPAYVVSQPFCRIGSSDEAPPPCPAINAVGEPSTRVATINLPQGFFVLHANVRLTSLADHVLQDNRRTIVCHAALDNGSAGTWPSNEALVTLPAPGGRPTRQHVSISAPMRLYFPTTVSLFCRSDDIGLDHDDVQVFAAGGR